jgi:hypothetical protein
MSEPSIPHSIWWLTEGMKTMRREAEKYQQYLNYCRITEGEYRREIERKEAYWKAHPELTPVGVGWHEDLAPNVMWSDSPVVMQYEVQGVDVQKETGTVRETDPRHPEKDARDIFDVPLVIICECRKAWLAQQGETT